MKTFEYILAALLILWVLESVYDTILVYLAARNVMRELGKDVTRELKKYGSNS